MCIAPGQPSPPPPPPPPPPAPEKSATTVGQAAGVEEAQKLAARLGTSSLSLPFTPINVTR